MLIGAAGAASMRRMEAAEVRYAWNGEAALAYRALGDGPVDLVYLQGYLSNVELLCEHPALGRFLRELGRFARVIVVDRRGLGCSERFTAADTPPIESLMGDVGAVLDDVGSQRAVLFATGDCGFIAALFAATYPGRLSALVLHGAVPSYRATADAPWGWADEHLEETLRAARAAWGDGSWARMQNPSLRADERTSAWAARYERLSLAPGSVYGEVMRFMQTDIRTVLESIHVPTLVMHRTDAWPDVRGARHLAAHIRGARYVELAGADLLPWLGDQDTVVREVERFVAAVRDDESRLDRVLATLLFTDIVGSTQRAAALGDHAWRELVARHHATVRALLARYRGREIDTAGDSFFASFDGPARAVRCAQAVVEAVAGMGLEVRAGVHTGEVQAIEDTLAGIAVHVGARVSALAGPSEVLVSQTVRDLVAGSGLVFDERGVHALKGVPGEWRLYALRPAPAAADEPTAWTIQTLGSK